MRLVLLTLALLVLGCAKTEYTHGVPNLVQVEPGLWRSGQPTTREQWDYLRGLGVRKVVKLNFESEGSDAGAVAAGLEVHVLSIQPAGDADVLDSVTNTFKRPDTGAVIDAEVVIASGGGVLVHCTHGQDRTGIVIGVHRVTHDGWTKQRAYEEMLQRGFHPELHGLHEYWEAFR